MNRLAVFPMEYKKAWAAGFIDGEGSFGLEKVGAHSDYVRGIRISACQKKIKPILELQELFGGKIHQNKNKGIMYVWALHGAENAKRVIPQILPYLIVKKAEAQALLNYAETVGKSQGRWTPLTEEKAAIRFSLIKAHREARING